MSSVIDCADKSKRCSSTNEARAVYDLNTMIAKLKVSQETQSLCNYN